MPLPGSRASPVSPRRSGRPSGSPGRLPPERSPCSHGISVRRRASGALIGVSGERCRPCRRRLVPVSSFPRSSSRSTTIHRFPHQRRHVPIASFLGFVPQGPQYGGGGLSFFVPYFFMAALQSSCVPCFSRFLHRPALARSAGHLRFNRVDHAPLVLPHATVLTSPTTNRLPLELLELASGIVNSFQKEAIDQIQGPGRPFVVLVLLVCPKHEPGCCVNRKIRYHPDQTRSGFRGSPSFPRKRESISITKVPGFPLSRE